MLASAASPVCDPADPAFVCARTCDNQLEAACADGFASRPQCINDCVLNTSVITYYGCGAEWSAYLACIEGLASAAENWLCFPGFTPQPAFPNCDPEITEVFSCIYGY